MRYLALVAALVLCSGCLAGYQHQPHHVDFLYFDGRVKHDLLYREYKSLRQCEYMRADAKNSSKKGYITECHRS